MKSLRTFFKEFGKKHILNILKDMYGFRVSRDWTIDYNLYNLDCYDQTENATEYLNDFKKCVDFWNYQ